jgi:hypothetical protein
MWFYLCFLVRGFSKWKKVKDSREKSIVVGCIISGFSLSICILVSPKLMEWSSIVVMATIIGLGETIIKRNEGDSAETVIENHE